MHGAMRYAHLLILWSITLALLATNVWAVTCAYDNDDVSLIPNEAVTFSARNYSLSMSHNGQYLGCQQRFEAPNGYGIRLTVVNAFTPTAMIAHYDSGKNETLWIRSNTAIKVNENVFISMENGVTYVLNENKNESANVWSGFTSSVEAFDTRHISEALCPNGGATFVLNENSPFVPIHSSWNMNNATMNNTEIIYNRVVQTEAKNVTVVFQRFFKTQNTYGIKLIAGAFIKREQSSATCLNASRSAIAMGSGTDGSVDFLEIGNIGYSDNMAYDNNLNCSWQIEIDPSYEVHMRQTLVLMESVADDVTVLYENNSYSLSDYEDNTFQRFRNFSFRPGTQPLLNLMTDGNIAMVGYSALLYTTDCRCPSPALIQLTEQNAIDRRGSPATCAQCPADYCGNMNCSYQIEAPEGYVIFVSAQMGQYYFDRQTFMDLNASANEPFLSISRNSYAASSSSRWVKGLFQSNQRPWISTDGISLEPTGNWSAEFSLEPIIVNQTSTIQLSKDQPTYFISTAVFEVGMALTVIGDTDGGLEYVEMYVGPPLFGYNWLEFDAMNFLIIDGENATLDGIARLNIYLTAANAAALLPIRPTQNAITVLLMPSHVESLSRIDVILYFRQRKRHTLCANPAVVWSIPQSSETEEIVNLNASSMSGAYREMCATTFLPFYRQNAGYNGIYFRSIITSPENRFQLIAGGESPMSNSLLLFEARPDVTRQYAEQFVYGRIFTLLTRASENVTVTYYSADFQDVQNTELNENVIALAMSASYPFPDDQARSTSWSLPAQPINPDTGDTFRQYSIDVDSYDLGPNSTLTISDQLSLQPITITNGSGSLRNIALCAQLVTAVHRSGDFGHKGYLLRATAGGSCNPNPTMTAMTTTTATTTMTTTMTTTTKTLTTTTRKTTTNGIKTTLTVTQSTRHTTTTRSPNCQTSVCSLGSTVRAPQLIAIILFFALTKNT